MKKKVPWWVWLLIAIGILFFIPDPTDVAGGGIIEFVTGIVGLYYLAEVKGWI